MFTTPDSVYNKIVLQVNIQLLQRYVQLCNEMPMKIIHTLQVVGNDPDGLYTNRALSIGLNKIPNLESISLNFDSFTSDRYNKLLFQMNRSKQLKRLKVILPETVYMTS